MLACIPIWLALPSLTTISMCEDWLGSVATTSTLNRSNFLRTHAKISGHSLAGKDETTLVPLRELDVALNQAVACSESGLVSYYKFDEADGDLLRDCTQQAGGAAITGDFTRIDSPFD